MAKDERSFGRTGPLVVQRLCDCNVAPWTDCEHTAWDAGKSLQRVIEQAQAPTPSQMEMELSSAPDRAAQGLRALMLLERVRPILNRDAHQTRKVTRRERALALLAEIDALGSLPC